MYQDQSNFQDTIDIDAQDVSENSATPDSTSATPGITVKDFKQRYGLSRDSFIRVRRKAEEAFPELDFNPVNVKGVNFVQFPEILIDYLPTQKTVKTTSDQESNTPPLGDVDLASEAEKALMRGDLETFVAILEKENERFESETAALVTQQKTSIETQNEAAKRIKKAQDRREQLERDRQQKLEREQLKKELLAEIHSASLENLVNPTRS